MPSDLTIAIDLPAEREPVQFFESCARPLVRSGVIQNEAIGYGLVRSTVKVVQEPSVYLALLECLIKVNQWSLGRWRFPPLYQSGIRYAQEDFGTEIWLSTPALYFRGRGDCEDLVGTRIAEHRNYGHKRWPKLIITGRTPSGGRLFHFVLKDERGKEEDPSKALGMR